MNVVIGVKGEKACFADPSCSRQHLVTYPVITPSAARGVLSSIFRKPEFDWNIKRIAVLRPGRSDNRFVNEIRFPAGTKPFVAADHHIQVSSRILRDVEYVIEAEPVVLNRGTPASPNTPMKYVAEFERRMQGKKPFYRTPCLGPREFTARVYPLKKFPSHGDKNLPEMKIQGLLIGLSHGDQRGDGGPTYPFFKTLTMKNGIIQVPRFLGSEYRPQKEPK